MSSLPEFRVTSVREILCRPPYSLPRPPHCLTPYPTQTHFHPTSRSPLSSPAISPEQLGIDPFDLLQSSQVSKLSPSISPPVGSRQTASKRTIPIGLRMSALSPTDSIFPSMSPVSLSPRKTGAGYRIPLSPNAKKYIAEKENQKKTRPDPILIPHTSSLGKSRISMSVLTAIPPGVNGTDGQGEAPRQGSVPFPKTPPDSLNTAVPFTSRRIGRQAGNVSPRYPQQRRSAKNVLEVLDLEEGVPVHRGEPSPEWAEFDVVF